MPSWVKVLLAIFGGFVLVIIVGGAGVFWYVHHNRARLMASGRRLMAEGAAYGRGRDANACIEEALRRGERGFADGIRANVFLNGCLKTATVPPEVCAPVPPRNEIIRTSMWAAHECERRGHPGPPCTNLMQQLQIRCEKR
jgi:hypothetical protein